MDQQIEFYVVSIDIEISQEREHTHNVWPT